MKISQFYAIVFTHILFSLAPEIFDAIDMIFLVGKQF